MKGYRIGKSIVLPNVRYVNHGRHNGRNTMMMFHSDVIKNNGKHKTLGCNKMDASGFCLGHEISMEDFLEKYCMMEAQTKPIKD
ncbi:MAG: hypothetical protein A2Y97_10405 [Nitrospirae bacterium RBG_13_39_12]|nr:MAG: hypothetical protein A2Y97_10405 [Nitrospirae bacterium RBG_13_39_12]